MKNNKSKIITVILLLMTVGLMFAIFYIGYILTTGSEKTSLIAPQKTKAQSANYSKFVALNGSSGTSSPTVTPTPTSYFSLTPTPTEIMLSNQNITTTPLVTSTASTSATPALQVKKLPQTGFITNVIVLFGVSALVIFISFIF